MEVRRKMGAKTNEPVDGGVLHGFIADLVLMLCTDEDGRENERAMMQ